jgi:hypothetical protein
MEEEAEEELPTWGGGERERFIDNQEVTEGL